MRRIAFAALLLIAGFVPAAAQSPAELLRRELEAGRAAEAVRALEPLARADANAHMALGFAQFTRAVERLAQGLFRFGLKTPQNPFLPVVRLPIPENPTPEAVDYAKLRQLYQGFLDDLATARATLNAFAASATAGEAKLVLDLNSIRLTLMAEGAHQVTLGLREVAAALGGGMPGGRRGGLPLADSWEVAFDRADAIWLAAYSHVTSALFEFVMAHDWQPTFDATGHLFFAGALPPQTFTPPDPRDPQAMAGGIADQLALLHLVHWPAGSKERLGAARNHLKSAIALSRQMWAAVEAETDDDREWLPAPRQQSRAVPTLPITEQMVAGWLAALDDFEALLDGRKLLGHWRFRQGIDLRKFFEEPQPFDLLLWATGHGAIPFLRDGPILDGTVWQRWNAAFGGNFLGYAFFIN